MAPRARGPGRVKNLTILNLRQSDVIRKEAWSFYRTISGVRLYWGLEEPKGPKSSLEVSLFARRHCQGHGGSDASPGACAVDCRALPVWAGGELGPRNCLLLGPYSRTMPRALRRTIPPVRRSRGVIISQVLPVPNGSTGTRAGRSRGEIGLGRHSHREQSGLRLLALRNLRASNRVRSFRF